MEELLNILWAYRTTPRTSIGETPYALAYGVEAVIPLEVGLPTIRIKAFNTGDNDHQLGIDMDFTEERREVATLKLAKYQEGMS